MDFETLENKLASMTALKTEVSRLAPLFRDESEYNAFTKRHNEEKVGRADLKTYTGDAFLGIDCGSTTTKIALISDEGKLLYSGVN